MQNYINPIGLLNLDTYILSGVAIRKAKKSLLAEIELSEKGTIIYNGNELTKSDCIRAIDDLDHKDKRDFHIFIFENPDLNQFLTNGDLKFFKTFKTESIYKFPEFIDFISPYFSAQYAKALSRNFKANNFNNVKSLLSIKPIVNDSYIEDCYKLTYAALKEIENEIIKITKEIEFNESEHFEDGFADLPQLINQKVNVDLINLLPSYFQSLRNQIAQSVRNLARDINNDPYNLYKPAFEIIKIAQAIQTDGLVKQTITKGYYTIKSNYEDVIRKKQKSDNQQSVSDISTPIGVEVENDNKTLSVELDDEKTKSKNIFYWFFLSGINAVGFFYNPIQKIILVLSLLILLIPLIAFIKDKGFSINLYLKRNIIFIVAAFLSFFYPIIAQLYVSYYFLVYLNLLFNAIANRGKDTKSNFLVWYYATGAVILTFFYYNYFEEIKVFPTSSHVVAQKQISDKDYFQKGSLSFQQSNFTDAIVQFDKAIALNPNYTEAYFDRGVSKANLGQNEAAILDYQKSEELGLRTSILYSNYGIAYYQLKQFDKALAYLEKAVEIDANNSYAYKCRGDIKYDRNDNKGAINDYTTAILLKPSAANYFARALAFYYLKEYKKAIADMDIAIELNPNVAQYYFDRGDAKEMLSDFNGACRDWQTAKEKGYEVPDYKINRCIPKVVNVPNGELYGCYGVEPKYNRRLDNKLEIAVGSNACVAVKLINISNDKCIRYVFINKNSTYLIRNIPEGRYYLKIAYGDDWSIMEGQANCTGKFTKNTLFEKGQDVLDYNLIYSGKGYQIPSFSLKLNLVISEEGVSKFETNTINENDFYNE